jgi:hypothetical protein
MIEQLVSPFFVSLLAGESEAVSVSLRNNDREILVFKVL